MGVLWMIHSNYSSNILISRLIESPSSFLSVFKKYNFGKDLKAVRRGTAYKVKNSKLRIFYEPYHAHNFTCTRVSNDAQSLCKFRHFVMYFTTSAL